MPPQPLSDGLSAIKNDCMKRQRAYSSLGCQPPINSVLLHTYSCGKALARGGATALTHKLQVRVATWEAWWHVSFISRPNVLAKLSTIIVVVVVVCAAAAIVVVVVIVICAKAAAIIVVIVIICARAAAVVVVVVVVVCAIAAAIVVVIVVICAIATAVIIVVVIVGATCTCLPSGSQLTGGQFDAATRARHNSLNVAHLGKCTCPKTETPNILWP